MASPATASKMHSLHLLDPLPTTGAELLAEHLAELGCRQAFGISGGGIAPFYDAVCRSDLELVHCRHEGGAVYSAIEAYHQSGRPSVVFATTGPGLLNTLSALSSARWDGAKVVLVSGATSQQQQGRWATQETGPETMPQDALYSPGRWFDVATYAATPAQLRRVLPRLAQGLAGAGSFVGHVGLPLGVQTAVVEKPGRVEHDLEPRPLPKQLVERCAELLRRRRFAVWVGFGATRAARQVRQLVERTAAPVISSPRGKGILPEDHPCFAGVTGLGGHDSVYELFERRRPQWILVLGSRLGEATSFWDPALLPSQGFLHVDIDPDVPGAAFPDVRTIAVEADIADFLDALLEELPEIRATGPVPTTCRPLARTMPLRQAGRGSVAPQELMQVLQRVVVDGGDAPVLSECGGAFVWCSHCLVFKEPGRFRLNTFTGALGHFADGVVGAALARRDKAVAVVGDGAMLMGSELHTAVVHGAPAVWVVLNDGGYGSCRGGHRAQDLAGDDLSFGAVDFASLARSLGAGGVRIDDVALLEPALVEAMESDRPFVVDVVIDPDEPSPLERRFRQLAKEHREETPTCDVAAAG